MSPIMLLGVVGQRAIVPDKATVLGRPRVRQVAPSLGSLRRGRQKGLGYTRDSENLVGHSLALQSLESVLSKCRDFQEIVCVAARNLRAGPSRRELHGPSTVCMRIVVRGGM